MGGYTLIINSHSIALAQHPADVAGEDAPFDSPILEVVERFPKRMTVADTDESDDMHRQIEGLEQLIAAYQSGEVPEQDCRPLRPLQYD
jgi:fructose-1,6-bisphosphatase-3